MIVTCLPVGCPGLKGDKRQLAFVTATGLRWADGFRVACPHPRPLVDSERGADLCPLRDGGRRPSSGIARRPGIGSRTFRADGDLAQAVD